MEKPQTKAELVAALTAGRDATVSHLKTLSPADLQRGVYENGWSGHQVLAHIASIEWTYPRLIDLAQSVSASGNPAAGDISGFDISAYNQRQVDKRAEATLGDLTAEFERNRTATIAAVEAMDEALLDVEVTSAGNISGPLRQVIAYTALRHVEEHLKDIAAPA